MRESARARERENWDIFVKCVYNTQSENVCVDGWVRARKRERERERESVCVCAY